MVVNLVICLRLSTQLIPDVLYVRWGLRLGETALSTVLGYIYWLRVGEHCLAVHSSHKARENA